MDTEQPHLLLVDDEPDILKVLTHMLQQDYRVTSMTDPVAAVSTFSDHAYQGVLSDHFMPGMTGVELLTLATEKQPSAGRILLTASDSLAAIKDAVNVAHVHRFLTKPLFLKEVRAATAAAVKMGGLEAENARLIAELQQKNDLLSKALSRVQEHQRILEHEVDARTRELQVVLKELKELALRDGLTGLYNHRYFQETLVRELALAARHNHTVGLIFLDVDHFKNFNDAKGHPAGDALLKTLARIVANTGEMPEVTSRGRVSDIAARYGGEEFVVVLPRTHKAGTVLRAQRLRESVWDYNFEHGDVQPAGRISVSVGVACFPDDALDKTDLIRAADDAMLRAKRDGRNRVVVAGT